jgi:hypothetical protein
LRDVRTAKSGLVLERWWVDRLRTVVISGDDSYIILGKDLERARQRKEVPASLKKIVSFCFFSYLQYVTEYFFLET